MEQISPQWSPSSLKEQYSTTFRFTDKLQLNTCLHRAHQYIFPCYYTLKSQGVFVKLENQIMKYHFPMLYQKYSNQPTYRMVPIKNLFCFTPRIYYQTIRHVSRGSLSLYRHTQLPLSEGAQNKHATETELSQSLTLFSVLHFLIPYFPVLWVQLQAVANTPCYGLYSPVTPFP